VKVLPAIAQKDGRRAMESQENIPKKKMTADIVKQYKNKRSSNWIIEHQGLRPFRPRMVMFFFLVYKQKFYFFVSENKKRIKMCLMKLLFLRIDLKQKEEV